MEREQILADMQSIIQNLLNDNTIILTEDLKPQDIKGWDSLAHFHTIIRLEKQFKIRLSVGEIVTMENFGDLVTIVKNKIDSKTN